MHVHCNYGEDMKIKKYKSFKKIDLPELTLHLLVSFTDGKED